MSKELGSRLRAARMAVHPTITQREVAKRLGLTPGAVNLWEAGKTEPDASALKQMVGWYGVTADWLLGAEESRPHNIWTVPVVTPAALVRWEATVPTEELQTVVSYPPGTAAAFVVETDALTSTCPTGCYAVVCRTMKPIPGCVVLASTGPTTPPVLRKWVREGRDDLLVADDARYQTYRPGKSVRIIGRVVEVTIRRVLTT